MQFGYSDLCLEHDTGTRHPECPDRLRAIQRGLERQHCVEYVDAPSADVETVTAVHDEAYVEEVRSFCEAGGGEWDRDTVAVEESWDAIMKSAGLACWAAERALDGDDGRATPFSIGRPPGHHAVADDAMGFCFVNNVAVAAQAALDDGADGVAVIDWDVHHGNGTQDVFYDREDVFVASLHEAGIYPGTGDVDETGTGSGAGRTLNVPLPESGDAAYEAAIEELVAPLIEELAPDLLLVSAGFDAHKHDPISRMNVTTEGYGNMTRLVRSLAEDVDAGLGFVLEGGYSMEVLAESVRMVEEVCSGYEPVTVEGSVGDAARSRIDEIAATHPGLDGD